MAGEGEANPQSRRPLNTPFRQQQMRAWQPILTPRFAIITFFVVGLVFVPIGIVLLLASQSVVEASVRYDDACVVNATCVVTLNVTATMKAPVFFYYELENFYQNHRRYVSSRSNGQLHGEVLTYEQMSECLPMLLWNASSTNTSASNLRNPCGLVAASLFNDTFVLANASSAVVPWTSNGILWSSDLEKFRQPSQPTQNVMVANVTDPDFIVWMRTAALPRFKKLYRVINQDLPAGSYQITIQNRFPVSSFDGRKYVFVSTTSWLGGKNDFLGIAYLVVGGLCLVLALIFLIKNAVSPRKLGDTSLLRWSE